MLGHSSAHLLSPVHPSFQFILPLLFIFAVLCLVSCVRRRPKAAPSAPVCARTSVHLSLPFYSSVCISLSLPLSLNANYTELLRAAQCNNATMQQQPLATRYYCDCLIR